MRPLLLLAALVGVATCDVQLELLSALKIPYRRSPNQFELHKALAEKGAYDSANGMFYVVSPGKPNENSYLDVIDISTPSNSRIVHTETFTKGLLGGASAVQVCDSLVAVTILGSHEGETGVVRMYRPYRLQGRGMQFVREFRVGHSPDALLFTRDCGTLFVLNEGYAGRDRRGNFVDPVGTITKITYPEGIVPPRIQTIDFRQFNDEASLRRLVAEGARKVWNGQGSPLSSTTLAQDLEPEECTLSDDQRVLYVTLQENNAIARIDVQTGRIISLNGLGFKEFNRTSGLDPSDEAQQKYLEPYPVQGIYQPDPIKYITIGSQGYVITGDEGSTKYFLKNKHGFDWQERVRANKVELFDKNYFSEETLREMKNNKRLGRLFVSSIDPLTCDGRITRLRAYGGRGFSVHQASDLRRVYDSGSQIAELTLEKLYPIFNMQSNDEQTVTMPPSELSDFTSDYKGTEINSLVTGVLKSKQLLFVGLQNLGAIAIYSFPRSVPIPVFEGLYRQGSIDEPLKSAYVANRIGDLDITHLVFIPESQSVSRKNLLVVTSQLSGTVSIYEVKDAHLGVPK